MMEKDGESPRVSPPEGDADIEEHFPADKLATITHSLANSDSKTICSKMAQYDQLDSEERYPPLHAGSPSPKTCP